MPPIIAQEKPAARYEQVKLYITGRIAAGEWQAGRRLPSESELVEQLGVSRMTVHRALRELMAEGVVTRAQGVGTFVAEPRQRVEMLELRDIADDITAGGHTHTTRVVALDERRADSDLATAFEQRPGARLFHSVIVHYEDGTPLQVEERFVSPHFAPDFLDQDFTLTHPHRYLSRIAAAEDVEHVVFAVTPDPAICALLDLREPEACLQLMRRTWVGGRVVMKGIFTSSGSRYSFVGRYRP
ncbi:MULTISPECIES: histidine utilization repressor [Nguyenibacter]|uniref:Histidine utilization repressor n=1 Tax=Nguyenibacter vanlangensis TaxID=1216886 RepID=A0A7Y7IZ46_9PROT|nr:MULTISPECIES: histidine utilization repressor [Nguyenibacter]NVN13071.1 histidine utilization repressor [Nguyenibacter vanlangensis]WRH86747.1 histidine utilization repressor [Nguyenibacter sp. L1]